MGKIVDSVGRNSHHILNSAAVFAKKIDAGLNGHYLTCAELSAKTARIKPRALVDKESHRMTERMTECSLVFRNRIYNITGDLVCLAAVCAFF